MKKILHISISSLALLISSVVVLAADLPAKDTTILKEEGIPVYAGAEYVNGRLGESMQGLRLVSPADLEEVRAFYRSELPSWALNAEYGSWILYNGEAGTGPAAYMGKQQVMVVENKMLPEWFGLDESKTIEIVIVVPK